MNQRVCPGCNSTMKQWKHVLNCDRLPIEIRIRKWEVLEELEKWETTSKVEDIMNDICLSQI